MGDRRHRKKTAISRKKIHYMTMLNLVVVGNVLVAFLVIGVILGTMYYRYMREDVMNLMRSNVEQTESYTSSYITSVIDAANKLSTDVELGKAVENYTSDEIARTVEGKKILDYILTSALSSNSAIENIAIGTENGMIVKDRYSIDAGVYGKEIHNADWYQEILKDEIAYEFGDNTFYQNSFHKGSYYFYATKFKVKFYPSRDQEDRILIVTFDITELENYIRGISNNEAINIHICEEDNGKTRLIYQSLPDERISAYVTGMVPDQRDKEKIEREYAFFERQSEVVPWNIIGSVSQNTLRELIYRVEPWMFLVIGVVLIMSIITGTVSARVMSRPMKKLSQAMTDMENSKFHDVEENSHCIEIGQLIVTYNQMSATIEELIDRIKIREEEKRKLEFKVLEEQINPHFIYNTLDAVKWVALVNHSNKIAEIIESFVSLLRISLSKGQELIPVGNEITLVQEYANIMVFRNNYEITINYDISEAARDCATLKLVLQPFVENSFLHAFGNDKKDKEIWIRSYLKDDNLVFEVEDNGYGFLEGQAGEEPSKQRKQMTGIGIDNIDRRIKAWHGDSYGVEILSEKDSGTKVVVRQPIIRKEEKNDTSNDSGR